MERSLKYRLCTEERTGDLPLGFMELILSKDITITKGENQEKKAKLAHRSESTVSVTSCQ